MLKLILLLLCFVNPVLAFTEVEVLSYNKVNFRNFAKLSAILSQCDIKNIDNLRLLNNFSKEEGLKLAKEINLSKDSIAQEVSMILYELDQEYPEKIPSKVCDVKLEEFKNYYQKVNNENKK